MTISVRVRAQANGGKYIGPAVATAPVLTVSVAGKQLIPSISIPNKASGTVVPQKDATSSPFAIVVQQPQQPSQYYPTPGTYWLDPPADGQADVVVALPVKFPTLVEFRLEAYAPQPVFGFAVQLIEPGVSYTGQPGVVVPVPGLYVPQFTVQPGSGSAAITAKVQMMCGCPITQQPASAPPTVEPYWPSNEFEVTAVLTALGKLQPPTYVKLACTGTDEFTGQTPPLPRDVYSCVLSAYQPSTGNRGGASAFVTIT